MEREFHNWLKSRIATHPLVELGIGDDAAVLDWAGNSGLVVTTDALSDQVHFDWTQHDASRIGRKLIAVNLSDLAAMGARPVAALLTFNVPQEFSLNDLQQLFEGCLKICTEFEVAIVGGDTNACRGPLNVSATLFGTKIPSNEKSSVWKLSTAQAGDEIVVSGKFGGSILGHHLDFIPRVKLAAYLKQNYQVHAATDASDSLSLDLAAMALQSGVGVELASELIPVSAAAHELARRSRKSALEHALTDGEDFELLLAIPPEQWQRIQEDQTLPEVGGCNLHSVGRFVQENGFWFVDSQSNRTPFQPAGYSH